MQCGFTLVEMAIVLAIVALILGGLLPTISGQVEQRHRQETLKQLDDIQQALIGYAIVNGKLPCPADPTIATGSVNAGVAPVAPCPLTTGVIPWTTLGTSEMDSWGHRFTYAVSASFTTTFTLASTGTLTVVNTVTGGSNIATNIPAVFVSHGTDGSGAYTSQGTQIAVSSDPDELDNSNGGTTFVSKTFTPTFDDLVNWVSPNILFNRMVMAGKLP